MQILALYQKQRMVLLHVQALLISKEEDSINIGLEMMGSLGVPEKLITELFIMTQFIKRLCYYISI